MIHLAAALAGFAGLLAEMVLVRRHGSLLGNTAEASALVLSIFLLGLGLGGLMAARAAASCRGPLARAALLYAGVAGLLLLTDPWIRDARPATGISGMVLVLLSPGLPALLMGMAFPQLFAGLSAGAWRQGLVVAANLLGSVAACLLGGHVCIPAWGLTVSCWSSAAAYGLAALCLVWPALRESRGGRDKGDVVPVTLGPGTAALAFVSGFAILGFELLWLRRLPFFLEGFAPTLSGVLAACLIGLTLGAALLAGPMERLLGRRAPAVAVAMACLAANLGFHEWGAQALAQTSVHSEAGMHLRILLASAVAAGPTCLFLGAVIPLCLSCSDGTGSRVARAGRLFFWQGLGSVLGGYSVGQLFPAVWPEGFFVLTPPLIAVAVLFPLWKGGGWGVRVVAISVPLLALSGVGGAGSLLDVESPIRGSRHDRPDAYRYLAHRTDNTTTASVVYDQKRHSMLLFTDEFRAAETGPGTDYMKALGHLPFLLRDGLRRVAIIALGTGTTAAAVREWSDPEVIDVVEISPAVLELAPYFSSDGPVHAVLQQPAWRKDSRTRVHVADGRRFLAMQKPASLDLVTMEPLLPYAPGTVPLYTEEFYVLAGRALSEEGLLVQWVPTHGMPAEFFATLLATFARSFPHHSVWLIDQATLLVGSRQKHLPDADWLEQRFKSLPIAAQQALHATGLARPIDLQVALLAEGVEGISDSASILRDDRPFLERIGYWDAGAKLSFYPTNLEQLRELVASGREGLLGDVVVAESVRARLRGLRAQAESRYYLILAEDAAREHAWLLEHASAEVAEAALNRQLALADLARLAGERARAELLHARSLAPGSVILHREYARIQANDTAGGVNSGRVEPGNGPLDRLGHLPRGRELAEIVSSGRRRGQDYAAAFPSRCAWALMEVLSRRAFTGMERAAFLPLLDPALLDEATVRILARGGSVREEILSLWGEGLPMPLPVAAMASGEKGDKLSLLAVLEDRSGGGVGELIAELLMDRDLEVRRAAGVACKRAFGIDFDPLWSEARRRSIADGLRR